MTFSKKKKKINLRYVPVETDYILPKDEFSLGPEFKETSLGYSEDSIAQYRGPNGQHVIEFKYHYKGHRDHTDPKKDPLGHAIKDAPEIIVTAIVGTILAIFSAILLFRWKEKKQKESEYGEHKKNKWEIIFTVIMVILFIVIFIIGIFFLTKYLRESKRETIFY